MTYEELANLLRQNQFAYSGVSPSSISAPSINDIISGIQSQYQPVDLGSYSQPSLGGASRYITGASGFGDVEQIPEFGRLNQLAGPSFVPSAFDKSVYENVDTQKLSDLISQIDSGGGGGDSGSNSVSVDDAGLATSSNIGTMGVTGLAMALGAMTGLPAGLVASLVGKQNIANAINAQSHAQAVAFNQALVAAQMGLTNSPANAAALAAAVDSLSAANQSAAAAVSAAQSAQGATGATGGAAAAAAADAAAAAAAAGHSDAAIAAASQAAADATIGGASSAAAAAAAADAANAAAADAADAEGGGLGTAATGGVGGVGGASSDGGGIGAGNDGGGIGAGEGLAVGGKVTSRHMIGPNPKGKDDGYVALDRGEYVIKKSSVDKYGETLLSLINEGKVSKKKLQSLI
jgi:hypothetical protein